MMNIYYRIYEDLTDYAWYYNVPFIIKMLDLIFGVLTPLLEIFQLYHGDQF